MATLQAAGNSTQTNNYTYTPNPAKDFAIIHFDQTVEKATLVVYDLDGRAVISQSLNGGINTFQLRTQTFKKGVYVVKVSTASGSYQQKLFVE